MSPAAPLVLIVDDYEDNRFLYEESLRVAGFRVVGAGDAQSGLAAALAEPPDIVLMDVRMPGIDGFEAIELFRSEATLASVPILVLTAHVFPHHARRAQELGTAGFLRKPCLPDDVIAEVRRVLSLT
jgi:CheY-like chemotaxis protein